MSFLNSTPNLRWLNICHYLLPITPCCLSCRRRSFSAGPPVSLRLVRAQTWDQQTHVDRSVLPRPADLWPAVMWPSQLPGVDRSRGRPHQLVRGWTPRWCVSPCHVMCPSVDFFPMVSVRTRPAASCPRWSVLTRRRPWVELWVSPSADCCFLRTSTDSSSRSGQLTSVRPGRGFRFSTAAPSQSFRYPVITIFYYQKNLLKSDIL